jgi:hypothetical protein
VFQALLIASRREDLAAIALEGKEVAVGVSVVAFLTDELHGERARRALDPAHLPLSIFLTAFGHTMLRR